MLKNVSFFVRRAGIGRYLFFVRLKKPISIPAIQICNIFNEITVATRPKPACHVSPNRSVSQIQILRTGGPQSSHWRPHPIGHFATFKYFSVWQVQHNKLSFKAALCGKFGAA
jgi:hypothetical protein